MPENNCAVYVHVNLINGKKYFGITSQNPPEKRWQNGNGYYKNAHFMNAIKKYGWENFAHIILYHNIPIRIAKNIEEMLIKENMSYDPRFGYNKTMGGELEIPSDETREAMSKAKKGDANPAKRPEVREAISEALKGENNPTKRPEVAEKIAKALSKPVEVIDQKTGKRVYWFSSTKEAGRAGFHQSHVCDCCNGKRKTHAGYIWRWVEGGEQR